MIRILIADDHAIVRRGLSEIVSEQPDMEVVGEAETGHEAAVLLGAGGWDVAVLDISMPGRTGLELLEEVKASWPEAPVLILSVHPEEQYAIRALRAGAAGYVNKASAPEELVSAIRKAVLGRRYVSESLAERLAVKLCSGVGLPHERLSDRELQVLCMIASGQSISGIAEQLGLSPKTVSTHRVRLLVKMGMTSNAELVRYAVESQLVE